MKSTKKSNNMPRFDTKCTKEFIAFYRQNECLWNTRSVAYRRHDLKKQAIRAMSKRFHLSEVDVRRKIHTLRGTYVVERRKVLERKSCGEVYAPNLSWYGNMSFLDDFIVFRKTSMHEQAPSFSNKEIPVEAAELQDSSDISLQSECKYRSTDLNMDAEEVTKIELISASPTNDPLSKNNNSLDEGTSATSNNQKDTQSDADIFEELNAFARSIILQLRRLPEEHVIHAMDEIQQIVTKRKLMALEAK